MDTSHEFHLLRALTDQKSSYRIIWLCNIGAEQFWNDVAYGVVDVHENRIVNRMEEINLLLCREQDLMILREAPDPLYLETLKKMGFQIPSILTPKDRNSSMSISQLVLSDTELLQQIQSFADKEEEVFFVPYAITYLEEEISRMCGLNLVGGRSELNKTINDKIFNREISNSLGYQMTKGKVCTSYKEIEEAYIEFSELFECVVIKDPYGASGKGLYIIQNLEELRLCFGRRLRSKLEQGKSWLVEGWYKKQKDLNYQIYIPDQGDVETFSINEQMITETIYTGSMIPARISEALAAEINQKGKEIGKYLYQLGYRGIAGIDSILTDRNELIPIIEINGRFTLSSYLSFLKDYFGEKKMLSRYIRFITSTPFDYKKICSILHQEGLLMNPETLEGIFIYISGTLPTQEHSFSDYFLGRLFVLIVSDDWTSVQLMNEQLEQCINKINVMQVR